MPQNQDSFHDDDASDDRRAGLIARPGWAVVALLGLVLAVLVAWTQKPDPLPGRLSAPGWVEWLRYPVETNARLRLPGVPATMLDLHVQRPAPGAATRRVWIVGRGGSLLHSDNDGQSWTASNSPTESDLFDLSFDERGEHGWVVGSGGALVRTRDRGRSWTLIDPSRLFGDGGGADARQITLNSVQVLPPDGQTVVVASNRGRVFISRDGGETWQEQVQRVVTAQATGLRFERSGQRGWMAGRGAIAWTDNGGQGWQAAGGLPEALSGQVFELPRFSEGELRGWTVARNGTLLSTDDGGRTWRVQQTLVRAPQAAASAASDPRLDEAARAAAEPRPVEMRGLHVHAQGQRLWVTAADGSIWRSTDAGDTWAEVAAPARTALRRIVMDEAGERGWALGADGVILSTGDGGQTWAQRTRGAAAVMLASHASEDGLHLWVAGHDGLLIASADGGERWARQDTHVDGASLHGLAFLPDRLLGWAVTSAGGVIATRDGGRNWSAPKAVSKRRLRSIHADADGLRLWATGDGGEIWHASDGGTTWKRQTILRSPDGALPNTLHRLRFLDQGQRGWAVGNGGWLARTDDGGQAWRAQPLVADGRQHTRALRDIRFDKDGVRGWIVGDGGAIFLTEDGGQTWQSTNASTGISLLTLAMSRDGLTGFAAGEGGVIVVTTDGGRTWRRATRTVGSARTTLAMDDTGQTGWAFGYPPSLLQTNNFGESWESRPWPVRAQRLPAPWFWVALLFVGAAVWQAFRPRPLANARGVEAMGTTDAPTEDFARDRLQFAPLARGISRFLRNTRTEPPLTIAISGDWGSGKSSLMALVCADLRRYGSRPVWFNAWHHQSEEQMLAALLTGIRDQGLPSLRSPDGWVFRLRLLWLRSRKHFVFTLLLMGVLAMLIGYLAKTRSNPGEWTSLLAWLGELPRTLDALGRGATPSGLDVNALGAVGSQFVALVMGGFGLHRGLKAFGADPSVLAVRTAANFRMKDASAQTGFRARYAEQFDEVTQALPYRLVIVIDDLDRCKPEAVLSVMEAVNFLVSSGRCFVVFGMSTARVEAALALAFEKIARELVELDASLPANATPEQRERAERERRRTYVRDYLEKLINLEITVPQRSDLPPEHLLAQTTQDDSWTLMKQALAFWPLLLGAAVIFIGIGLGRSEFGGLPADAVGRGPAAIGTAPTVSADADDGGGSAAPANPGSGSAGVDASSPGAGAKAASAVRLSDARSLSGRDSTPSMWPLAAVFLAFVLVTGGVLVYRVRNSQRHVQDTQDFTDALRIWLPVVARRRSTPRLIKRFGNRLRYLAMLQQAELPEPPLRDLLLQRWRQRTRQGRARLAQERRARRAAHPALAEHRLVALGSLHQVFGSDWRARLTPRTDEPAAADGGLQQALEKAVAGYVQATQPAVWPPGADELALFDEALRGVRLSLAGDASRGPSTAAHPAP